MAIQGDTLFVSDIDSVRAFGRTTGEYHGARGVPGATFLNDLTVGTDGTLYVSDSGLNPDFSSSGTDAIYRFDGDEAVAVARGTDLNGPNGIIAHDGSLTVVSFGAAEVRRVGLGDDGAEDETAGVGEIVAPSPAASSMGSSASMAGRSSSPAGRRSRSTGCESAGTARAAPPSRRPWWKVFPRPPTSAGTPSGGGC